MYAPDHVMHLNSGVLLYLDTVSKHKTNPPFRWGHLLVHSWLYGCMHLCPMPGSRMPATHHHTALDWKCTGEGCLINIRRQRPEVKGWKPWQQQDGCPSLWEGTSQGVLHNLLTSSWTNKHANSTESLGPAWASPTLTRWSVILSVYIYVYIYLYTPLRALGSCDTKIYIYPVAMVTCV